MSVSKRLDVLKKMDLAELEETLDRQNALLKNIKVIEKLRDKGESIRKFRDSIEKEIRLRKQFKELEEVVAKMSLTDAQKHQQKLFNMENEAQRLERYKPSATLNKVQEVKPNRKIFKVMEDCSHCTKTTKSIPLPDSMRMLQIREERYREERMKANHVRAMKKLYGPLDRQEREYEANNSDDDGESNP